MKTASYKTLQKNAKIRRAYAYKAIERESFSENSDIQEKADEALESLSNGTMSLKDMIQWAVHEKEWRELHEERKIIKTILLEFASNDIIYLAKYLQSSDEEKADELTYLINYEIDEFIEDYDYESIGYNEREWNGLLLALDAYEGYEKIDYAREHCPQLIKDYGLKLLEQVEEGDDLGDPAMLPSWFYLKYKYSFRNNWLIHFTDNSHKVADEGFKYGISDMSKLGLTTYFNNEGFDKKYGGYNFAYPLDRRIDTGRYGKEAVIFRASGVVAYHNGDEENQAIFIGTEAKNRVPIFQGDGEFVVNNLKTGDRIYGSDDIDTLIKWVIDNFTQYHKRIAFDK